MAINKEAYLEIIEELKPKNISLVAVSKTKPVEDIRALYDLGQRDFGENYVQELTEKAEQLPKDINWHFIGHLQSNKVKYIAPFIHLVHSVDTARLLAEINKQALKNNKVIDCLLQVHIAQEETKFGMDETELDEVFGQMETAKMPGVQVLGLMGMASFIEDMDLVRNEFQYLRTVFDKYLPRLRTGSRQPVLSMGMSADFRIAIEEGSTMIRIGSLLFGSRK